MHHNRNFHGAQEYDAIDFPSAQPALAHYYREGLSPWPMPSRRRRFAPWRNTDSLRRPGTTEPPTEELKRQWSEIAELRCEKRDWLKQKRDMEIQARIRQQRINELEGEVRFLQQRSGTAQHRETSFRGIPSVEFTCSTG